MRDTTVTLIKEALKMRTYMPIEDVQECEQIYADRMQTYDIRNGSLAGYRVVRFPTGLIVLENDYDYVPASRLIKSLDGAVAFISDYDAGEFANKYADALGALFYWSQQFDEITLVPVHERVCEGELLVYVTLMWCKHAGELRMVRNVVVQTETSYLIKPYFNTFATTYMLPKREGTIANAILQDKWQNAFDVLQDNAFVQFLL